MANKANESLAAKAAAYLRESTGALGCVNGIQQDIQREADLLVAWARERGILLNGSHTDGLTRIERDTTEHVVYLRRSDLRVIKCTKPGRFGYAHGPKGKRARFSEATPLFYLQRLELMNQEFPTDLRLEGIALDKPNFGDKETLRPYIVTSQRFIEPADQKYPHPSQHEIDALMAKLGFKPLPSSCYNWFRESDGIIVLDTKQLNFINSPEGIVPIDLIIGKLDAI